MSISEPETARLTARFLVRKAATSALEVWAKMKPLILSAALAYAIVNALFSFVQSKLGISSGETPTAYALLNFAQIPFTAVISAPLAIAVHRLILLGEVTPGIISLRRSYHWLFFAWLCAITLTSSLLREVASFIGGSALIIPEFVILICVAVFGIKSSLVFPAIAIEVPAETEDRRLGASWLQMKGKFWLLVRAIILTFLPLFLLALLTGGIIGLTHVANWPTVIKDAAGLAIVAGILQPIFIIMAAAIASWLYAWIQQHPVAAEPSTTS